MEMNLKKTLSSLLIILFIVTGIGVTFSITSKTVKANTTVPKNFHLYKEPTVEPTFEQLKSKADLIVRVQIVIRNTSASDLNNTCFNAHVLRILRNTKNAMIPIPAQILISQAGTYNTSINGYSLFKPRETYLLFLTRDKVQKNKYFIAYNEYGVFKIINNNGNDYGIKEAGRINDLSSLQISDEAMIKSLSGKIVMLDEKGISYPNQKILQIFKFKSFENILYNILNSLITNPNFIIKKGNLPIDRALTKASDDLGMKLFVNELTNSLDKNVLISPLSIFTAFNVLLNGTAGDTEAQLRTILGVQGYTTQQLNDKMNTLMNIINNYYGNFHNASGSKDKGGESLYNSLWINNDFKLKDDFVNISQNYYNSDVFNVNMADKNTSRTMNNWINNKSNGLIKDPITQIDKNTKLYIMNVLYFLGTWNEGFWDKNTVDEDFTLSNNSKVKVAMMNDERSLEYYEDGDVKLGVFPYNNGNMMFLLPKGDINSFAKALTADKLNQYFQNLNLYFAKIKVPKLNLTYSVDLTKDFKSIGLTLPFDSKKSDFSKLTAEDIPLYISNIDHKCVLKLDEKGTEAAALTTIGIKDTAVMRPTETGEFYLNKPYLLVLQDINKSIIFIGKVEDPTK